jgi:fructan beta-fructosidase
MRILFKFFVLIVLMQFMTNSSFAQKNIDDNEALYRPVMHFTPQKGWMNDPNGMFYKDGVYHLYYQHYPDATVWGPMHWGHATSTDLLNWKHEPIALYPDSIGMIFSGSAVVDKHNTSGFGVHGKAPIVAIFTQHNMAGEKAGRTDFQNQSIAYSNDNGYTWKMFAGNPVVKNPGIKDFRDPKVMWHEPTKKWIMTVAVKNKVSFYSSPNLKDWKKESDFGEQIGCHDGVWECPDLFSLQLNNKEYWVLTSSINPGGPNKGSATQYFIGTFDGHAFKANSNKTKWMDYGADNYAGVTFSNTGDKKISIGWMSNWMYAQQVPTMQWRSATTSPRELTLTKVGSEMYLTSNPIKALKTQESKSMDKKIMEVAVPYKISLADIQLHDFTISLSNEKGEHLDFGYDQQRNEYFIDRTNSGRHEFNAEFAAKHIAPRFALTNTINLQVIIDKASIEIFADKGLTVMTDIFFPSTPYSMITVISSDSLIKKQLKINNYLTP